MMMNSSDSEDALDDAPECTQLSHSDDQDSLPPPSPTPNGCFLCLACRLVGKFDTEFTAVRGKLFSNDNTNEDNAFTNETFDQRLQEVTSEAHACSDDSPCDIQSVLNTSDVTSGSDVDMTIQDRVGISPLLQTDMRQSPSIVVEFIDDDTLEKFSRNQTPQSSEREENKTEVQGYDVDLEAETNEKELLDNLEADVTNELETENHSQEPDESSIHILDRPLSNEPVQMDEIVTPELNSTISGDQQMSEFDTQSNCIPPSDAHVSPENIQQNKVEYQGLDYTPDIPYSDDTNFLPDISEREEPHVFKDSSESDYHSAVLDTTEFDEPVAELLYDEPKGPNICEKTNPLNDESIDDESNESIIEEYVNQPNELIDLESNENNSSEHLPISSEMLVATETNAEHREDTGVIQIEDNNFEIEPVTAGDVETNAYDDAVSSKDDEVSHPSSESNSNEPEIPSSEDSSESLALNTPDLVTVEANDKCRDWINSTPSCDEQEEGSSINMENTSEDSDAFIEDKVELNTSKDKESILTKVKTLGAKIFSFEPSTKSPYESDDKGGSDIITISVSDQQLVAPSDTQTTLDVDNKNEKEELMLHSKEVDKVDVDEELDGDKEDLDVHNEDVDKVNVDEELDGDKEDLGVHNEEVDKVDVDEELYGDKEDLDVHNEEVDEVYADEELDGDKKDLDVDSEEVDNVDVDEELDGDKEDLDIHNEEVDKVDVDEELYGDKEDLDVHNEEVDNVDVDEDLCGDKEDLDVESEEVDKVDSDVELDGDKEDLDVHNEDVHKVDVDEELDGDKEDLGVHNEDVDEAYVDEELDGDKKDLDVDSEEVDEVDVDEDLDGDKVDLDVHNEEVDEVDVDEELDGDKKDLDNEEVDKVEVDEKADDVDLDSEIKSELTVSLISPQIITPVLEADKIEECTKSAPSLEKSQMLSETENKREPDNEQKNSDESSDSIQNEDKDNTSPPKKSMLKRVKKFGAKIFAFDKESASESTKEAKSLTSKKVTGSEKKTNVDVPEPLAESKIQLNSKSDVNIGLESSESPSYTVENTNSFVIKDHFSVKQDEVTGEPPLIFKDCVDANIDYDSVPLLTILSAINKGSVNSASNEQFSLGDEKMETDSGYSPSTAEVSWN